MNASSAGNSTVNATMGSGLGRRLVEYIFGVSVVGVGLQAGLCDVRS